MQELSLWFSAMALAVAALPAANPLPRIGGAGLQTSAPRFDSDGALLRPKDFETWVFVGSSTGLTYESGIQSSGPGEFHDVYIRPESYREYVRTGKFPEKTILVLAVYAPKEKISPAKAGYFEGDLEGLAAAVKDHERFPEGWAYFNFSESGQLKERATPSPKQTCFSCHKQHAADDNVFVQFYPVLRPIAQSHLSSPRSEK
ncbi:MAG TPA: cytochrome P460 family protein [Candidatus Cybelea sp.]|nr:cytochrome P460 family protein [Candidatus Cybelea sp.]